MKKYFILAVILFLPVFVKIYCFAASPIEKLELSGKVENGIRIIEIKASQYKFDPDPIVVALGEKVRLVVTSIDVEHGIAISEFNVRLSIPAGKTESIEFVADKKGHFHAFCSVYCGPGHGRMQANFIVE